MLQFKKLIILASSIFILLFLLIIFTGCSKNDNNDNTIQIKVTEVTRSIFYAPQYVSISKGFFEQQGLKIDLATGDGADKVMAGVLSGSVDIGFCGPESAIYVYNEGKEDYVEIFAQLTKRDGSFIIGREMDEDFKIQDLQNKTILPGRKGGVPFMTLEYIIKQQGLIPNKDVILDNSIQFSLMASAFSSGIGNYVTLFEPTASLIEQSGKGYILSSVGSHTEEVPYTTYLAKKSYIKDNIDIIQKFTQAVYEGQKWINQNNSKDIANEISSFFPDTDIEILISSIDRYKKIDVWNQTPFLSEDSFYRLQEIMMDSNELSKKAPYSVIVNNTFANNIIK